jgi:hypothetical protein
LPSSFVTDDFFSTLNRYQYDFKKCEYVSLQFANTSNKAFFTNFNLKLNTSYQDETHVIWSVKLDTTCVLPPAIVYNSASKQNCILVQDVNNTLYYVNNSGNILWRSRLSGRIMSDIKQVDAQRNGKIYYLFNTDKQACMIDETGANLVGYPVRFPGVATASLALFDCNSDSSYQFFVPLENSKIIAYTLAGKPLQGWNPKTVDERISTPIAFMKVKSVSYLLTSGSKGNLTVYSIKGEKIKVAFAGTPSVKIPVFTAMPDSVSTFVAITDTSGILNSYRVDADLQFTVNGSYNLGMKPDYLDARMDMVSHNWSVLAATKSAFVFWDKPDHKTISQVISDSAFVRPFFTNSSTERIMIGTVNKKAGKLNWYTANGDVYPSFPIDGATPFSTGSLMFDGNNYLVCGDRLNNLLLFRLK